MQKFFLCAFLYLLICTFHKWHASTFFGDWHICCLHSAWDGPLILFIHFFLLFLFFSSSPLLLFTDCYFFFFTLTRMREYRVKSCLLSQVHSWESGEYTLLSLSFSLPYLQVWMIECMCTSAAEVNIQSVPVTSEHSLTREPPKFLSPFAAYFSLATGGGEIFWSPHR